MVDSDIAETIARDQLADTLDALDAAGGGDMAELMDALRPIVTALRSEERPPEDAITDARAQLRALEEDLDTICRLYEIPRWRTGVRWGDLDEEERRAARGATGTDADSAENGTTAATEAGTR